MNDSLIQYHTAGWKRYEFSNHLGNVLAVTSDRKIATDTLSGAGLGADYYYADLFSVQDYDPFGMVQLGRSWKRKEKSRFGFNGKEDEEWGVQDFDARCYEEELGRWLSCDPMAGKYPFFSPYQFAENTPIAMIDYEGLIGVVAISNAKGTADDPIILTVHASYVYDQTVSKENIAGFTAGITKLNNYNSGVIKDGDKHYSLKFNLTIVAGGTDPQSILAAQSIKIGDENYLTGNILTQGTYKPTGEKDKYASAGMSDISIWNNAFIDVKMSLISKDVDPTKAGNLAEGLKPDVLAHEVLHTLGIIDHSQVTTDLMAESVGIVWKPKRQEPGRNQSFGKIEQEPSLPTVNYQNDIVRLVKLVNAPAVDANGGVPAGGIPKGWGAIERVQEPKTNDTQSNPEKR